MEQEHKHEMAEPLFEQNVVSAAASHGPRQTDRATRALIDQEFEATYRRWWVDTVWFMMWLGLGRQDAEDVAQDAWFRIYRTMLAMDAPIESSNIVFRALANVVIDLFDMSDGSSAAPGPDVQNCGELDYEKARQALSCRMRKSRGLYPP